MNILMICTVEFDKNGITKHIMSYYEQLQSNECCIDIVIPNAASKDLYEEVNQKKGHIYQIKRNKNVIQYVSKLKKLIKLNQYDIVHIHGNSCTVSLELFAAWLAGCKRRIAHSHNTTCTHKILNTMLRPIFELLCTDRFACGTDAGKWMFKNKSFEIIPNALDIEKYRFSEEARKRVREKLNLETNTFLLGHVGLFNLQKNHKFMVQLMKLLKDYPEIKIVFVGKGELENQIKDEAHELGVDTKILFYGQTSDVVSVLCAMDAFVFPSKFEGLGIALVEAQLTGLYCFASENVPQITRLSSGVEYLALDVIEKWKKGILEQYRKKAEDNRKNFIDENIENIKRYDIKDAAIKIKILYQNMLERK